MLDDVLGILEDGGWHPFLQIANHSGISEEIVLDVARFLSKYDFAEVDDEGKKVKLDPKFLKLPV